MTDDKPIELHGHKSASQRREWALQVEAMKMKILADHLRSVVILLLRQRPGDDNCLAMFTKEEIAAQLGQKLDSVDSEDKLSVVFSCDPVEEETPAVSPSPAPEPKKPIILNALGQVMEVRDPNKKEPS